MSKHRVKRFAHDFAALHHVEVRIVRHNISEALVPFRFLQPAHLFAVHLADDLDGLIGESRSGCDLAQRAGHDRRQQFVAQTMLVVGAALLGDPCQIARRVPFVDAVTVEAGVSPRDGPVAAHRVAVGMLGCIRANDAAPALAVGILQQVATLGDPRQHVIIAIIA